MNVNKSVSTIHLFDKNFLSSYYMLGSLIILCPTNKIKCINYKSNLSKLKVP